MYTSGLLICNVFTSKYECVLWLEFSHIHEWTIDVIKQKWEDGNVGVAYSESVREDMCRWTSFEWREEA